MLIVSSTDLTIGLYLKAHHQRRKDNTAEVAAKDADLAERDMTLHLFDVVAKIESNLTFDFNLDALALKPFDCCNQGKAGRRTKRK